MPRVLLVASVLLTLLAAAPSQGLGQIPTQRTWSPDWMLCTAGSLRACSSMQVGTRSYIRSGAACDLTDPLTWIDSSGEFRCPATEVTFVLRNLQGSTALDNTWISAIDYWRIHLASTVDAGYDYWDGNNNAWPGQLGGPIGDPIWAAMWAANPQTVELSSTMNWDGIVSYLAGCNLPTAYWGPGVPGSLGPEVFSGSTCDPTGLTGAYTFTKTFNRFWSTADIVDVEVSGLAFAHQGDVDYTAFTCSSSDPGCTVVPEPATLVLLGSGLIGLAGLALWKRRDRGMLGIGGTRS